MNVRRAAAASSIVLAVAVPRADATGARALDGKARTHAAWNATLSDPAVKVDTNRANTDPLTPTLADCSATSCDITQFQLTLPRNVSGGRFAVSLAVPRSLNVYVSLYNGTGGVVTSVQGVDPTDGNFVSRYMPLSGAVTTTYAVDLVQSRLRAGRYTLVVYDRGGTGAFTATVDYTALHPDRASKK